jgi:hypothetical protein
MFKVEIEEMSIKKYLKKLESTMLTHQTLNMGHKIEITI